MRHCKLLPSEPRERREKVCAEKFQITACIYIIKKVNNNSHLNLTSVLFYLYFEIRRALDLTKKRKTNYFAGGGGGVSGLISSFAAN